MAAKTPMEKKLEKTIDRLLADFNTKDRKDIELFFVKNDIEGRTAKEYLHTLAKFRRAVKKDLLDITNDDVLTWIAAYKKKVAKSTLKSSFSLRLSFSSNTFALKCLILCGL